MLVTPVAVVAAEPAAPVPNGAEGCVFTAEHSRSRTNDDDIGTFGENLCPALMAANTTLRSLQSVIEDPWRYEWAIDAPDKRPFGAAVYLPVMAIVYLASLTVLKALLAGAAWLERPLKGAALINNVIMCIYSLWALVGVGAGVLAEWADAGYSMSAPFCDRDRRLLKSLDFQMYVFFLSKFWEWFDTYVLVLKGKDVYALRV